MNNAEMGAIFQAIKTIKENPEKLTEEQYRIILDIRESIKAWEAAGIPTKK
jgi:hypothetical protein